MEPTTALASLLAALAASETIDGMAQLLGIVADLLSLLGPLGERFDRALLQGKQYERNEATLEAYLGEGSKRLVAQWEVMTERSVDKAALMGMAAEAAAWGVTTDPKEIGRLIHVAWVRGGISPTGASTTESPAERTAKQYEELLDAIARGDVRFLQSRGFDLDEQKLAGLSGQALTDALIDAVSMDPVTSKLVGTEGWPTGRTEFMASPYEQSVAADANVGADFGRLMQDSPGFWYGPGAQVWSAVNRRLLEGARQPRGGYGGGGGGGVAGGDDESWPDRMPGGRREWGQGGGGGGAGAGQEDEPVPLERSWAGNGLTIPSLDQMSAELAAYLQTASDQLLWMLDSSASRLDDVIGSLSSSANAREVSEQAPWDALNAIDVVLSPQGRAPQDGRGPGLQVALPLTVSVEDADLAKPLTDAFEEQIRAEEERWHEIGATAMRWFGEGALAGVNATTGTAIAKKLWPYFADLLPKETPQNLP